MNKKIVFGSTLAVAILILASFSSVAGFQISKSKHKNLSTLLDISNRKPILLDEDAFSFDNIKKILGNRVVLLQTLKDKISNLATLYPQSDDNSWDGNITKILIQTILVEFFIFLLLSPLKFFRMRTFKLFLIAVIINTITNPALNLVYKYIYDNILVLEGIVVLIESFMIYRLYNRMSLKIRYPRALVISLVANLFSYLLVSERRAIAKITNSHIYFTDISV